MSSKPVVTIVMYGLLTFLERACRPRALGHFYNGLVRAGCEEDGALRPRVTVARPRP